MSKTMFVELSSFMLEEVWNQQDEESSQPWCRSNISSSIDGQRMRIYLDPRILAKESMARVLEPLNGYPYAPCMVYLPTKLGDL
jgi:hypothetical protein